MTPTPVQAHRATRARAWVCQRLLLFAVLANGSLGAPARPARSPSTPGEADLALSVADAPDSAALHGNITYGATITNNGPSAATGASLIAHLALGQACAQWVAPACTTGVNGDVQCPVPDIPAGASVNVMVAANTQACPSDATVVSAVMSVSAQQPDPDLADNSDEEGTSLRPHKGDLDLDASPDLVLRNATTGELQAWRMVAGSRSGAPLGFTAVGGATWQPGDDWAVAGVDDFGGDGRNDLLIWNSTTGEAQFALLAGAEWQQQLPIMGSAPLPTNWKPAATADVDRDGSPDIVWRNWSSQKIVVWLMSGNEKVGAFMPTPAQALDANWEIVGVEDFNADGYSDFLWYNQYSGKIVLWYMNAAFQRITGAFTEPASAGANNWKVLAVGDYGEGPTPGFAGTVDLVWRNAASGSFVLWYLDLAGRRTGGLFTAPKAPETSPTAWTIVGPR